MVTLPFNQLKIVLGSFFSNKKFKMALRCLRGEGVPGLFDQPTKPKRSFSIGISTAVAVGQRKSRLGDSKRTSLINVALPAQTSMKRLFSCTDPVSSKKLKKKAMLKSNLGEVKENDKELVEESSVSMDKFLLESDDN